MIPCSFQLTTFTPFPGISTLVTLGLISILGLISLLHFYWAVGGKWGLDKSVPHKIDGTPLFVPNSFQCFIVGVGLFAVMSFLYLWRLEVYFSEQFFKFGLIALGGIFTIRAIGDFNYVGFFKKIKNTEFGQLDAKFFSPLCLLLGGSFFWLSTTI